MKTTLTELLKQITPLPWTRWIDRTQMTQKQVDTDLRYAEHAANVLPEVVKALENISESFKAANEDYDIHDNYIAAQKAIKHAQEIDL